MSPRSILDGIRRETAVLDDRMEVQHALREVLDSGLPALPVERDGRYAGIFGERESFGAMFPRYLETLGDAGFVGQSIEDCLAQSGEAATDLVCDHMTTEDVDVRPDDADVHVAATFLHHRVLIIPVTDDHCVVGVITRSDFFRAVAERFLAL